MTLSASKSKPLKGTPTIPGDKSISHRALMLGALAIGKTTITGLLEGEDVLHTAEAMRQMGADISKKDNGIWEVHGVGIGGLRQPEEPLEMGNSGTSTRLLIGLVAGHNISAKFTGDASLSKRPMQRIMTPLETMGASFKATDGDKLPLTVHGAKDVLPIEYRLPVASAQVKSAIILAGLNSIGQTTVIEEKPTRDYTENMLRNFGADITTQKLEDGAYAITIQGQPELKATHIDVPADPSSAAFAAVAAVITPGSDITLPGIGMNERRSGVFECLKEMGADIKFTNERTQGGEAVADIEIKYTDTLRGIEVPPERVPSMIDEFPIFAIAAACAAGTTKMTNLAELRVKESDRLLMMANGLKACGVALEMGEDSLTIQSNGRGCMGGATVKTALDHRIAMSFLVLGGVTEEPVTIDDSSPIDTSFPGFTDLMNELGAYIK